MTDADLIAALVAAQRNGTHDVDAASYAALDRAAAYRVQTGVLTALGETPGLLKTAVHPDGVGAAAPIYASRVGYAPNFQLPSANVIGLEVEVGVVLGKALPAGADETQVRGAIDHYFLGVEICGSRYRDRSVAGPAGGLADSMSALGYTIGPTRTLGGSIDGLEVRLSFDGRELHAAPAKHGFGSVLASVIAYARNQYGSYPLVGGTIITTGSLCGMLPASGPGHVTASLGHETMEFDIV